MTWFKADDNLQDHPKVLQLGRDMVPAMGLWTLVGTWSARQRTDGFVPVVIIRRYDPRERLAKRLVAVGLFEHAEDNGAVGYRFHDWPDHQPTAAEVERKRSFTRERQRKFRERSGRFTAGSTDTAPTTPSETQAQDQDEQAHPVGSNGVTTPVRNGVGNALRDASVTTAPARPDPTRNYKAPPGGDAAAPRGGESNAQTLVAEWIERCAKRPPTRTVGQMAKTIGQLVDDAVDPDDIRRGLADWMTKDLSPGLLPSCVDRVMNRRSPPMNGNGLHRVPTTTARVAAIEALRHPPGSDT